MWGAVVRLDDALLVLGVDEEGGREGTLGLLRNSLLRLGRVDRLGWRGRYSLQDGCRSRFGALDKDRGCCRVTRLDWRQVADNIGDLLDLELPLGESLMHEGQRTADTIGELLPLELRVLSVHGLDLVGQGGLTDLGFLGRLRSARLTFGLRSLGLSGARDVQLSLSGSLADESQGATDLISQLLPRQGRLLSMKSYDGILERGLSRLGLFGRLGSALRLRGVDRRHFFPVGTIPMISGAFFPSGKVLRFTR